MNMIFKSLLIILFVSTNFGYEQDGNVLVLKDGDFPQVVNQNEYIVIKFYTSWCPHCQNLIQPYKQIADQFKQNKSPIIFAKVDCTDNQNASTFYQIEGYPKFIVFHNGQRLDYQGQRNKVHMINWLNRITKDPLIKITQQQYQNLQSNNRVSIVYHGDDKSNQSKIIKNLAYVDMLNDYYITQVGKQQGTVQMFRPVDPTITYPKVDQNIKKWIQSNQRQLTVPFTDQVIEQMFVNNKTSLCLFNDLQSQQVFNAFAQSAKIYLKQGKQMLFTYVEKTGQHYARFADFLKTTPSKVPIVLIDKQHENKYVLIKDPSTISSQDINEFLNDWSNGKIKKYQLPDKIKQLETEQQNNQNTIKSNVQQQKQQIQIDESVDKKQQQNTQSSDSSTIQKGTQQL